MKATLEKWGYEYDYSRSGVEITGKPDLPEEKLKEILIRKLNLDVQINAYDFACFLCAFTDIGSFDSMPWDERAIQMQLKYDVDVTDRTLRSWCKRLIGSDIIQKCGRETFWKTQRFGKEKYRTPVAADDDEMAQYFQKKSEYLEVARLAAEEAGKTGKEAAASAWDATYKSLWREFGCCYYACRGLLFNAIGEDYIFEIYELAQEIAAAPVSLPPDERKINSKEDYHETWFRSNL
ncbi:hypothetical protein KQI82_04510 [Oscillibacter sp. MSJ-2]|uniref:Uncharacterized protein n=1 Tax=Dysosmobacter acutus TaxID=2841504 RepID=A0ABS6FA71_9FIRM|nr:hypothetical protein [Dysosmobacter acutus]MBU5626184.1 hypothetical protein [Dysosmobacter acutus]